MEAVCGTAMKKRPNSVAAVAAIVLIAMYAIFLIYSWYDKYNKEQRILRYLVLSRRIVTSIGSSNERWPESIEGFRQLGIISTSDHIFMDRIGVNYFRPTATSSPYHVVFSYIPGDYQCSTYLYGGQHFDPKGMRLNKEAEEDYRRRYGELPDKSTSPPASGR